MKLILLRKHTATEVGNAFCSIGMCDNAKYQYLDPIHYYAKRQKGMN